MNGEPKEELKQEQIAQAPEVKPDVELERLKNLYEEEKRKREEMENELKILREQMLKNMTQQVQMPLQPTLQGLTSTPQPTEEVDIDPYTKEQLEKYWQKVYPKAKEELIREWEQRYFIYREREKAIEEAKRLFPDLNNPSSTFFKKVEAFMNANPKYYYDPHGILDACSRVAYEMGLSLKPPEKPPVEGSTPIATETPSELPLEAKILAKKLGISEEEYKKRLERYLKQEGEYQKKEPTQTGKMRL